MRAKICIVLVCLYYSSFPQSLNKTMLIDLHRKIDSFISKNDTLFTEGRSTEFVQLILKTDSNGILSNIHVMGDERDSLYKIFKSITIGYFNNWGGPKDKIIFIPYFYLSENPIIKNYIDWLFINYYRKIPGKDLIKESGNVIIVKWLMSVTPLRPREGLKTGKLL